MVESEFKLQLARLKKRDGWDKKLDNDFATVLWKKIKAFHIFNFEIAVEALLGQHRCPNADDIYWLVAANSKRFDRKSSMLENDCDWCDHFGMVMMTSPCGARHAPYQCTHCDNGETVKKITSSLPDCSIATARQGWGIGWRPENVALLERCNAVMRAKSSKPQGQTQFQDACFNN